MILRSLFSCRIIGSVATFVVLSALLTGCAAMPLGIADDNTVAGVKNGDALTYPSVAEKLLQVGEKRVRKVQVYLTEVKVEEDFLPFRFVTVDVATRLQASDSAGTYKLLRRVLLALTDTYPSGLDVYVSFSDAEDADIDLRAAAVETGVRFVQDEGSLGIRVNQRVLRLLRGAQAAWGKA